MVVESIHIDRKIAKVIAKVIPAFKYYICTGFEISSISYRNNKDNYTGTDQGNLFLGETCR